MSAQARIVYSDSTGNVRSMNTYTDAVSRGQFRITAEGDTLAVRYTLGAVEEKKLVPIVVEQERFETLILNRLTDTQKKTLERYYMLVDLDNMQDQNYRRELEVKYPAAKKGPVWVLRNNPPAPNIEDKIHEIVVMTGYTREDLEADNAANQVADSGPDMVFNLVIRYTIEDGPAARDPAGRRAGDADGLSDRAGVPAGAFRGGPKRLRRVPPASGRLRLAALLRQRQRHPRRILGAGLWTG